MRKLFATLVLAAMLAGGSSAAMAGSCPKDMKAIDAALSGQTKLTKMQLAEVTKLRAEGEALHKAGKHPASVAVLHEAMHILGIK